MNINIHPNPPLENDGKCGTTIVLYINACFRIPIWYCHACMAPRELNYILIMLVKLISSSNPLPPVASCSDLSKKKKKNQYDQLLGSTTTMSEDPVHT